MKKLGVLFALGLLASACGGGDDSPLSTADLGAECDTLLEKSDIAQAALDGDPADFSVDDVKSSMDEVITTQEDFFTLMARWEETTNAEEFTNLGSVMSDMKGLVKDSDAADMGQFQKEIGPKIDTLMEKWEDDSGGGNVNSWVSEAGKGSLPSSCDSLIDVIL